MTSIIVPVDVPLQENARVERNLENIFFWQNTSNIKKKLFKGNFIIFFKRFFDKKIISGFFQTILREFSKNVL